MYDTLKEVPDLISRFVPMERGYYVVFRYEDYRTGFIDLGCCYVRGFCEIALCTNEIVVISKYDDMKLNVKYKYISKVVVRDEY